MAVTPLGTVRELTVVHPLKSATAEAAMILVAVEQPVPPASVQLEQVKEVAAEVMPP
jgi:hypothetical protein